jgi:hypothetical protein
VTPAPADEDSPAPATPEAPLEASEKDKALLAKFSDDEKQALIFSLTGMSVDQIKDVQSTASRLQKEKSFSEIKTRIQSYCYSETNKEGTLNPTAVEKIATFAEKIPESLRAEFEEIISGKNFLSPSLFTEIGGGENKTTQFSISSETPAGATRESFVLKSVSDQLFSE